MPAHSNLYGTLVHTHLPISQDIFHQREFRTCWLLFGFTCIKATFLLLEMSIKGHLSKDTGGQRV